MGRVALCVAFALASTACPENTDSTQKSLEDKKAEAAVHEATQPIHELRTAAASVASEVVPPTPPTPAIVEPVPSAPLVPTLPLKK